MTGTGGAICWINELFFGERYRHCFNGLNPRRGVIGHKTRDTYDITNIDVTFQGAPEPNKIKSLFFLS
jgi:hypothetical protein